MDATGHTLDKGCFEMTGSPNFYDNFQHGFNWGWFARIIQQGLNQRDDCHIYNNIRVGSSNYGFIDYRQITTGYLNPVKPFVRGGDMYIYNNTCGNMITTNNYLTVVVVAYNFPGQHLYVYNNLRFNAKNLNSTPDSQNTAHYGSPLDIITEGNNKYYADPIAAGALTDSVNCYLKAGSSAIDAGIPVSWISNDFAGIPRPQGSGFDIGAREYDQNTPANQSPIAVADPKRSITLPVNTITLNGSASHDPDGSITAYKWSTVSGPSASMANASGVSTSVNGMTTGTYIFKLTVTDNGNATGSTYDTVIVNPSPNQAPVANAGNGSSIVLPVSTVTLDGTASSDPDNNIASYSWKELSGPATATITSAGSAKTTATGLVSAGQYIFQLTVTDSAGASSTATVKITVAGAGVQPPAANAGSDKTITLPTNSVMLDGSASIATAGGIKTYTWTQTAGPSTASIASGNTATTLVGALVQGVYIFKLSITDSTGASDGDSVTVTVNAAPNKAPIANAGVAQTITLPVNSVTLDGTQSSDPDGTIVSYTWTKISGPGVISLSNSTSSVATASALQAGSYTFQLTVKDNSGAAATDQVVITVNAAAAAPNQLPIANAGNPQTITLPTSSVTLDGTSSFDPDGTITKFSWSLVSGAAGTAFSAQTGSTTAVTGLTVGTYTFKLTVTDNSGASATDEVTITVKAAAATPPPANQSPTANAGNAQTITLPTSSVTLDGTGSYDPDGSIVKYSWSLVSGATGTAISTPAGATTTVSGLTAGTYTFKLTVTDNDGASATDQVTITVNPAAATPPTTPANQSPVANAGTAQTVTLPTSTATLDGTSSYDPDGSIVKYSWSLVSGSAGTSFGSQAGSSTIVNGLQAGSYIFKLTVTDNDGASATDQVTITVNAAAVSTPQDDTPPVAVAGDDTTVVLPTSTFTLDGTHSWDADGNIVSYSWQELSGPNSAAMANFDQPTSVVSGLSAGTYSFALTVTDSKGSNSVSSMKLTVIDGKGTPADALTIYPNPAHDMVNVNLSSQITGTVQAHVYDMAGKLILTDEVEKSGTEVQRQFNVSGLAKGMYTIYIVMGPRKKPMVAKFIKQ